MIEQEPANRRADGRPQGNDKSKRAHDATKLPGTCGRADDRLSRRHHETTGQPLKKTGGDQ